MEKIKKESNVVSQPITKDTNIKLVAISKKRKDEGHLIRNKQDILTKIVDDLHKKEFRK
jgi:hypothetical protein